MIHLRSVTYKTPTTKADFPFNLLILQDFTEITFTTDVTFLVGENGSGKSTFLEALACAIGSTTVGSESVEADQMLSAVRSLADAFKLIWNKRTRRGFFMRSEDYFGYVKHLAQVQADMHAEMKRVDREYDGRSDYAKGLAKMAYARELRSLKDDYGDGLDAQSHGESYLTLFQRRFVPDGLYLLDEPEAPLSPTRQLTFITLMHMAIQQGAQFIIATHSPILMAFPDATILNFDASGINPIDYDDVEHVAVTRSFLENPQAYLRHLMRDE